MQSCAEGKSYIVRVQGIWSFLGSFCQAASPLDHGHRYNVVQHPDMSTVLWHLLLDVLTAMPWKVTEMIQGCLQGTIVCRHSRLCQSCKLHYSTPTTEVHKAFWKIQFGKASEEYRDVPFEAHCSLFKSTSTFLPRVSPSRALLITRHCW